ncbi:MAG: PEP-CTERM sorting domain-containing protein [Planctomycetota bacterium]
MSPKMITWKNWYEGLEHLREVSVAMVCVAIGMCSSQAKASYSVQFIPLGHLTGGTADSKAVDVSADGSVIVGRSNSTSGLQAFRWTSGGGMVGLGDLPGGGFRSGAYGVSSDGSVVVGFSDSTGGQQAMRWTSGSGMVGLGDLAGGSFNSAASAVSSDGSVVVGFGATSSGTQATRWTSGTGMVGLGDLPGGNFFGLANAPSSDGSVVVGASDSTASANNEAFLWTSADGMVGLGDLPGGSFNSEAFDVSADGSVVVGSSSSPIGTQAFRWTAAEGMIGLVAPPAGPGADFTSQALGVSADGSIIVGKFNKFGTIDDVSWSDPSEAFLWTDSLGMFNLRQYLILLGATNLDGWRLDTAESISADGTTIVGWGVNPLGQTEAFAARIDTVVVPEASSFLLVVVGIVSVVGMRRLRTH